MTELHMLKLGCIFLSIIVLIWLKRPLYQAILGGLLSTMLLYQINPFQSLHLFGNVFTSWSAISILLILYFITFLQRMLEKRNQISLAQKDLDGLFHNRRINASIAPLFIGLLPSAAAMILCGDIVKESTAGYLDKKEQAFITSWFRHIPESTLPTYSGVLLMSNLTGVPLSEFMIGMIIPVLMFYALGYIPYLRKLPKDPGTPESQNKYKDLLKLGEHLWTLFTIIILILVLNLSVLTSVLIVIGLAIVVYKFKTKELFPMFQNAIEYKMLLNTFLVLVLKEFIMYTGLLEALPIFFENMQIPMYLTFSLLFFVGTMISGTNGIIALGTPIAFAAIPNAGMPLMVLLMCMCHIANQISPTHVCLVIATEYFGITMGELAQKTIPIMIIFSIFIIAYYHLLLMFV